MAPSGERVQIKAEVIITSFLLMHSVIHFLPPTLCPFPLCQSSTLQEYSTMSVALWDYVTFPFSDITSCPELNCSVVQYSEGSNFVCPETSSFKFESLLMFIWDLHTNYS